MRDVQYIEGDEAEAERSRGRGCRATRTRLTHMMHVNISILTGLYGATHESRARRLPLSEPSGTAAGMGVAATVASAPELPPTPLPLLPVLAAVFAIVTPDSGTVPVPCERTGLGRYSKLPVREGGGGVGDGGVGIKEKEREVARACTDRSMISICGVGAIYRHCVGPITRRDVRVSSPSFLRWRKRLATEVVSSLRGRGKSAKRAKSVKGAKSACARGPSSAAAAAKGDWRREVAEWCRAQSLWFVSSHLRWCGLSKSCRLRKGAVRPVLPLVLLDTPLVVLDTSLRFWKVLRAEHRCLIFGLSREISRKKLL